MNYIRSVMKPALVALLIIAFIYYDYWEDVNNTNNWKKRPVYSILVKGDLWKKFDIKEPPQEDIAYHVTEYKVAIPHRYRLEREAYTVDIEVNPSGRSGQVTLQILTTRQPNTRALNVKSSWKGNCAKLGKTSDTGDWNTTEDMVDSMGYPFFTNPKAVGFLWYPTRGYCKDGTLETTEHASSFPIVLKIYDNSTLLGEERIDIEIFNNGITKYLVMP